jgi:hypothetical protein
VIGAQEERNIPKTYTRIIRAANQSHVTGPYPGKHACAVHAQRNASVPGKSFGDIVCVFYTPLAADPPAALSRL